MPHNGRLFEMPPSQQIDCSDFSVCTHLRKKSNSADRTGIVFAPSFFWMRRPLSHRRGFEAPQSQQLWASLLHKRVTAHCGIFWVRWPSVQTPDGRTTAAAVFLLSDASFSRWLSPTQSRWVPCSARLENFVIRELLKCVAWVQSAVAHTHTHTLRRSLFSTSSLCFHIHTVFLHLWL